MSIPLSTDPAADLGEAKRLLADDDIATAWSHLQRVLTFPGAIPTASDAFREAIQLLATLGEVFAGEDFKEKALEVANGSPVASPEGLYDLGFEMVGVRQYGVAATLLARSFDADANEDTLVELIVALEREGNFPAALWYLHENPAIVNKNFVCVYQKAWLGIQVGDLKPAFESAEWLQKTCQDMGHERYVSMAKRVGVVTQRAKLLEGVSDLGPLDLRGWQYVLNGGLLLHISPYGTEVMNGRYCYVKDSVAVCLEAAKKIQAITQQQGINVPQVFVLPDPKSALLAQTLARSLDCPFKPWEKGCKEPGILAVYDMEQLEEKVFYTLYERGHPQQFLWAHAVCWTSPEPCVPAADFVTFLHQVNASPWDAGADIPGVDFETADPEKLVDEILGAELNVDEGDLKSLLSVAQAVKLGEGVEEQRGHQWPCSPVRSSRFA